LGFKKKFSYETDIRAFELIKNPEVLLKKVEQAKIICLKCHQFLTFRFNEFYISIRCGCGARIFYPLDEKIKMYKTTFISKREYDKRKKK